MEVALTWAWIMGVGVDMGWAGVSPSIHPSIDSFFHPCRLSMGVREKKDGMGKKRQENGVVSSRQGKQHRTLSGVSSNSPRTVTLQSLPFCESTLHYLCVFQARSEPKSLPRHGLEQSSNPTVWIAYVMEMVWLSA